MKTRIFILMLLFGVLPATGCEFLSSAFEWTFGDEDLPRLNFEVVFPHVDELGDFTNEELQEIPGYPASFGEGTLAHLQGALTVKGVCRHESEMEPGGEENPVEEKRVFALTTCRGESRCATLCPAGGFGMRIDMTVPVVLVDEAQAATIRDSLSDVDADSIVQIRFRFNEFTLFHEVGGAEVAVTHLFEGVGIRVMDESGEQVTLVEPGYLPPITEEEPQRFDLDSQSELTGSAKGQLLEAKPIRMTFLVQMWVPQSHLYEIDIDRAGVRIDIQPEIVINVLEAVKSKV